MSTATPSLTLKQAVVRAADALEAMQEIPSVADIAAEVGVTRQYLYRLANREIERRQKEKGATPTGKAPVTSSPTGLQSRNESIPGDPPLGDGAKEA